MLRVLLTILLLSAGLKIVTANGEFVYKYEFEAFLGQEESENDKAEKKASKLTDEENYNYYYPVHYSAFHVAQNTLFPVGNFDPYFSYLDQPNTPPPDFS